MNLPLRPGPMTRRALAYGAALACGALLLQWLDYQRLARAHWDGFAIALVAIAFLSLGLVIGARVIGGAAPPAFDGNPRARTALGLSTREMDVLLEIVAGHSNKEIAARLRISPSTVKTHAARVFEKLGARRRTEAALRARELGLVP